MQTHLINGRPKRFKVDREKTLLNIFLGPTVVFIVHLTLPDQRLNTWKTEHLPPRNGNPHTHTNAQPVMSSVLHWFLYLPCPSLIVKWPITYVCWLVLARTHIEKSVGENDERKKEWWLHHPLCSLVLACQFQMFSHRPSGSNQKVLEQVIKAPITPRCCSRSATTTDFFFARTHTHTHFRPFHIRQF